MRLFKPQIIPVTPTIWCVRRVSYLTCSYVVKTPAGIVLVDAGMDSGGLDMLYALEKLNLLLQEVCGILLTHWHNDHAAGGDALNKRLGAEVYYHAADAPYLTRATAHHGLRGWLSDLIPEWGLFVLFKGLLGEATPKAVAASKFVAEGDILFDGFEVIPTPGHTPGHASYYYRPERALFAGDALAVVGGKIHFMARPVTPEIDEARNSMRQLLSLEIDCLCPGHRGPLTKDVRNQCLTMANYIDRGEPWPLLG